MSLEAERAPQSAALKRSDGAVTLHFSQDRRFCRHAELGFHFCPCELFFQLDQLVIDSAMEKREMEHKHATIQQRVSS